MKSAKTIIETQFGSFETRFHEIKDLDVVSFGYGDFKSGLPLIRIHSACLFGEAFHSLHCDCADQLTETMKSIVDNGSGVITYTYQEGRGIGLKNKILAMEIERKERVDTVDAFKRLGFQKPDLRNFASEVEVLSELQVSRAIKLVSGNPIKRSALENGGFIITEIVSIANSSLSDKAQSERKTKISKMGYLYK